jgi:DNA mismatch repair protein MutS
LPKAAVKRAADVLAQLEATKAGGAELGDLPLFAAAPHAADEDASDAEDVAACAELRAALQEVEPDALTPRGALDLVYRLKRLAEDA